VVFREKSPSHKKHMATVAIDIRVIGRKRTGDETVFLELCTQLIRCHPEHQYYLLTDKTEEDLVLVQEKLSIPVCPPHVEIFNFSPQNKFWWNAYTAPRFLRRHREIDIFHTQYILPLFLPKELQVVAHIHDISFARFPHLIGFWDRLFLQLCIPYTMKRATLAVPSVFTKQEIQAVYNVPASRIVVIYNAVSLRFTTLLENSSSDQVEAVVQKYNLPKKYWLYVGTLQPRKNIPYLISY
jgi:glycosyltransferase involved in cell wall biosynthesis